MQIYHYNPETGLFLGTSQADPSPLEPGKYLIPAFATAEPVPEFDPTLEWVRWVGGVWQVEAIPEPEPEPEPSPLPEPEPQPDWTGLFLAMQMQWGQLMTLATVSTVTLAALLIGRTPDALSEGGMVALTHEWNAVVNSLPPSHGIDWAALAAAAAAHHCDLFAGIDVATGEIG